MYMHTYIHICHTNKWMYWQTHTYIHKAHIYIHLHWKLRKSNWFYSITDFILYLYWHFAWLHKSCFVYLRINFGSSAFLQITHCLWVKFRSSVFLLATALFLCQGNLLFLNRDVWCVISATKAVLQEKLICYCCDNN